MKKSVEYSSLSYQTRRLSFQNYEPKNPYNQNKLLTYCGWDKMAAILQMTFPSKYSCMKIIIF